MTRPGGTDGPAGEMARIFPGTDRPSGAAGPRSDRPPSRGRIRRHPSMHMPDKEEPRGGRDPGFRGSELVAGRGFEPLTFGL